MPEPTPAATTLPEVLTQAARRHPRRGLAIFDGRGRHAERRTYAQLLELARAGAGRLAALGVEPGDRVMVCLPSSWAWMEAWLGALLLGALPVAVAPAGTLGASEGHVTRLDGVRERLGCRRLITGEAVREEALRHGLGELAAALTTPEELATVRPLALPETAPSETAPPEPGAIAFLQLTSGSTGLPRAVKISHRAALHNGLASDLAIGAPHGAPASSWADCMVSWLPLHHDMGLVGCLFLCLGRGLDLWLLNPPTFLARPRLWLEHLGAHGVAFAPAPNFGYQLCAERLTPEDLQGLDLSGWRAAMTGAEMVRPETAAAFTALTEGCGFDPRALRPCYGLAEATLAVTFDRKGEGVRTRPVPAGADVGLGLSEVVCLGQAVVDTEVRVTAPDGSPRREGEIGEVRVKGPGVFAGYWGDDEATAESLEDGWLCTGDLGLMVDGELYLTGRTKDVLILRGHNLMPHELEWLAEEVTGGGGTCRSGAFSVARGAEGEQAVLVAETGERSPEALAALEREVRLKVSRALSLPLADLVFVRRGRLPKTTSGKVQRRQLRQMYLDGELERLGS